MFKTVAAMENLDGTFTYPGYYVDCRTKYDHVDEKESHSGRRGVFLAEAEQDRGEHHAEPQTEAAVEHGLFAAHAVQGQGGEEVADDEHQVDEAADDLGDAGAEIDAADEDGGHVIDDHVDADPVLGDSC